MVAAKYRNKQPVPGHVLSKQRPTNIIGAKKKQTPVETGVVKPKPTAYEKIVILILLN
jgi:hypothetical protein